ncbi:hypothetical protein [Antarcticirhabdus aurantiaca]|uniref:Uncharacterized protein n=1 Tax=Antarcticirhabdus aurantiaca TaxID=2606717 RepID=A0ACD4NWI3_9HYPH|nr:hypothetical protein [Antarcticirhabdus aurantiaca]WAJ31146.1 hypothetical protein OXU80_13485 [Jeongeuplla avenae]
MLESTDRLAAICAEAGIRIVPTSRRRRPGETHARGALTEILTEHGEAHLRFVLHCLRESEHNCEALWSEVIASVSDVLISCPAWRAEPRAFQAALNRIDLEKARLRAVECRPWPVRGSLRALLYLDLERLLWPDPGKMVAEAA